jgi:hypothetical protein
LVCTLLCRQMFSSAILPETTRMSSVYISNPNILIMTAGTSIGQFSVSFKDGSLAVLSPSSLTCLQMVWLQDGEDCFDCSNVIRVAAFSCIFVTDGQQLGTLILHWRAPNLHAHGGRFIPLIIKPTFGEAALLQYVVPLNVQRRRWFFFW